MPFGNNVFIRAALRAGYRCEMCGVDLSKVMAWETSAPFHIHSVTSLHLVRKSVDDPFCWVGDTPEKHKRLRGHRLPSAMFRVFDGDRLDDGFCLCHACHVRIHNEALAWTKMMIKGHVGRNSAPAILETVSLFYIQKGSF